MQARKAVVAQHLVELATERDVRRLARVDQQAMTALAARRCLHGQDPWEASITVSQRSMFVWLVPTDRTTPLVLRISGLVHRMLNALMTSRGRSHAAHSLVIHAFTCVSLKLMQGEHARSRVRTRLYFPKG